MQTAITQLTKRLGTVFFFTLGSFCAQAQSSALDVVRNWGLHLKHYAETGDIEHRIMLDEITPPSCLVNDMVAQRIASEKNYPAGTLRVTDYYNAIEKWKSKGEYTLELGHLAYQRKIYTFEELQKGFPEGTPIKLIKDFLGDDVDMSREMQTLGDLYVVMGRLSFRGALNWSDRILFFVRGEKITKIISTGDDVTLGKAVEFYLNKDYNKAFALFRKLANWDISNYMAQYYTAIMLLEGEGCVHIHPEMRRREAVWWLLRGKCKSESFLREEWGKYKSENGTPISFADYVLQFGEGLIYNHFPEALRLMVGACIKYEITKDEFPLHKKTDMGTLLMKYRPYNKGLMLCLDSKTGFYGYLNEKNEVVVPFKYPVSYPFNKNGLALISDNEGKKGFINTKGEEVAPCIYDEATGDFVGNHTCVIKDGTLILLTYRNKMLEDVADVFFVDINKARKKDRVYKNLKTIVLDNRKILIQNPRTKKWDMFEMYGSSRVGRVLAQEMVYNNDRVTSDINEIWEVMKDGKIIYSCYKDWQ